MITKISVDGFRSLSSFSMSLRPGLNMLVGPNGSGKTNIILFFEFLSHIASEPLGEAVSRCGGAGSIFQKVALEDFRNSISVSIEGEFSIEEENKLLFVKYVYDFTIEISDERDSIFFRHQRLKYYYGREKPKNNNWSMDISCELSDEEEVRVNISRIDFRKISSIDRIYSFREVEFENRKEKVRSIEFYMERTVDADTNILVVSQRLHRGVNSILSDLVGGEAFNIMPSAAREAEDSATPPGIRKDGSGLAATLHALKQIDRHRALRHISRWHSPTTFYSPAGRFPRRLAQVFTPRRNAFDRIVEFVRLVNDQILSLDVHLDHVDNKIKIVAIVKSDDREELNLPFSLMSDGTVKWVALIAAIFTYRSIFAIEEPENFIHPLMQKEIVQIMRGASEEKYFRSFVLMTTHSETLLNAATPDEVLVVSMSGGVTRVNRPRNRDLLRQEISRTGFGLGHYYLTGALGDG